VVDLCCGGFGDCFELPKWMWLGLWKKKKKIELFYNILIGCTVK
jgi:hypothetical protein